MAGPPTRRQKGNLKVSSKSKTFGNNTLATVTDIITNEEHPRYDGDSGGLAVGEITFKYTDWGGHNTTLQGDLSAMPLESELQAYPLIGETVFIQTVRGKRFYSRRVNINKQLQFSNSSKYVDVLRSNNRSQNVSQATEQARANGGQLQNSRSNVDPEEEIVSSFYKPIDYESLHNLKHFDGDIIIQNRYGATLRFGSSQMENAFNQQTSNELDKLILGPTKLPSDDPMLRNNAPIMIMRIGERENAELTTKKARGTYALTVEDINRDLSSFVLSSNQQINFRFSTIEQPHGFENIYFRSTQRVQGNSGLLADITEPDGLKKAALLGNQSLLNSDRLVFNAKTEDVIFSTSRDFISLTNRDTILDTGNDFVIGARQIYLLNNSTDLGTVDKSQKDRYDQVALAGEVVRVITELIDALCRGGAYTGGGPAPIMAAGLLELKGPAMLQSLNKIRSYLVRIEK